MHFISHFLTEHPVDDPLFAAGLLLPDLSTGFTRTYNKVIRNASVPVQFEALHKGILKHYEGDRKFHGSPDFVTACRNFTDSFIRSGLNRSELRLSFLSHIAVEMMIDRQILLHRKHIVDEYYNLIKMADGKEINKYFDHFSLGEQKIHFGKRFDFFKERAFVYLFNDLENVLFGLNRIYGATVAREFTKSEKQRIFTALHNMDEVIRYNWQKILST